LDWPATEDEMQVASTITRSRSPKFRKFGQAKFSKISSISNSKLNASTISIAIEEVDLKSVGERRKLQKRKSKNRSLRLKMDSVDGSRDSKQDIDYMESEKGLRNLKVS
jgi:hypothetical protein